MDGDVRMTRTYSLRSGALRVESALKNCGTSPVRCSWGSALHLRREGEPVIRFRARAGEASIAWSDMADTLGKARVLEGEHLPEGECRIETPRHVIVHRFADAPVAKMIVGKVEAEGILALDLRSASTELAPGEALRGVQQMRIERRKT
jgi:hypothetical protein